MGWVEHIFEEKRKSRLPVWFHFFLRGLLQSVLGYLLFFCWVRESYFFAFFFGLLFLYCLFVLFFGAELRKMLLEYMNK